MEYRGICMDRQFAVRRLAILISGRLIVPRVMLHQCYFAIITMATVGYGDIHGVKVREMIFIMIYVSFDMVCGAYLAGNMTAIIVKGSVTERFRDKIKKVITYMNRNKLGKDTREQIKGHSRLQYESSCTEASVLRDIFYSCKGVDLYFGHSS